MMVVFLNSTMIHQEEGKIRVSGLSDVGGAQKNWADVSKHPRGGGVKTQVTQPQVQLTQMPSDHPSDSIPMVMENEPFQVQEINEKCPRRGVSPRYADLHRKPLKKSPLGSDPFRFFLLENKWLDLICVPPLKRHHGFTKLSERNQSTKTFVGFPAFGGIPSDGLG